MDNNPIFIRLCEALGVNSVDDMARKLGATSSDITNAINQGYISLPLHYALSQRGITLFWALTGKNTPMEQYNG